MDVESGDDDIDDYTNMPMTVKYMVPASLMPHLLCRPTSQNVLMTCTAGCGQSCDSLRVDEHHITSVFSPLSCSRFDGQTGCNLTVRRQR